MKKDAVPPRLIHRFFLCFCRPQSKDHIEGAHIGITWTVFVLVSLFVLVLAIVIMSIESIRAATANPVKSLRTE